MCNGHFFHNWSKGSDVKIEYWVRRSNIRGIPIGEPIEYTRQFQDKTCERCGKYEKRYLLPD